MNLWIRSQSKEKLIKAKEVMLVGLNDFPRPHAIRVDGHIMGTYDTNERCIEILDEIYGLLNNQGSEEDRLSARITGIPNTIICYQMPEDSDLHGELKYWKK